MPAGDIRYRLGSAITLQDTSGTVTWGLKNLAAGAAIVSPVIDLGAGLRDVQWDVAFNLQFAANVTAGGFCEAYYGEWHDETGPARPDGQLPSTATTYASSAVAGWNKYLNLTLLGRINAETAALGPFARSFRPIFLRRHVSLFLMNRASQNLVNTDNLNSVVLTPVIPQIQAS